MANRFPDVSDDNNSISQKNLFDDEKTAPKKRKRESASVEILEAIDKTEIQKVLDTEESIDSVVSITKVHATHLFGKATILIGSFCLLSDETACKVLKIFRIFVDGDDKIILKVCNYTLCCDQLTGMFY